MTSRYVASDAPERSRFEVIIDGLTAFLTYRKDAGTMTLVHTEVPKELGGRGIGGELVETALASAKSQGLAVEAVCPFAKRYIEKKGK